MNQLGNKLKKWGEKNIRDYPWRHESSPYKIMIAEFMLQRTRADQVVPVYLNFIKHFPNIESLSTANLADVEELIGSLGLRWRAAHFIKSAQYILEEFNGKFPDNIDQLLQIPGIGEYASGAILAVAFSKSSCIVDSNIARVINRYYGFELTGEIRRKSVIVHKSCELFKHKNSKLILFSIIDLSSMICTPNKPKHEICPLNSNCQCYIKFKQNCK